MADLASLSDLSSALADYQAASAVLVEAEVRRAELLAAVEAARKTLDAATGALGAAALPEPAEITTASADIIGSEGA